MIKNASNGFVEKRRALRKSCFFIEVDYSASQDIFTESVRDISPAGVYIETEYPVSVGDRVKMLFSDFSRVDLIKISGDVVRHDGSGFAVAFDVIDKQQESKLSDYVTNV